MDKINLDKPFLGLDGKSIDGNSMAKFLAERLAYSQGQANFAKMAIWSMSLYQDGFVEIDEVDKESLIAFIKSDSGQASIIKHQLLKEIA